MMKKIFMAMWYGVKSFYEENRGFFLLLLLCISSVIGGVIGKVITGNVITTIILAIITPFMVFFCIRIKQAIQYSEEMNISIQEAWEATRYEDDGDGMYY